MGRYAPNISLPENSEPWDRIQLVSYIRLWFVWCSLHELAETRLARYLWLKGLPTLVTEIRDKDEMPTRHVIPTELGELLEWAKVARNLNTKDSFRKLVLVNKLPGPNGPTARTEVSVHVQGFVHQLDLRRYGTWRRG